MGATCCIGGKGMTNNVDRAREFKLEMLIAYLEADNSNLQVEFENKSGYDATPSLKSISQEGSFDEMDKSNSFFDPYLFSIPESEE